MLVTNDITTRSLLGRGIARKPVNHTAFVTSNKEKEQAEENLAELRLI